MSRAALARLCLTSAILGGGCDALRVPNPAYAPPRHKDDAGAENDAGVGIRATGGASGCLAPGCVAPAALAGDLLVLTFDDPGALARDERGRHEGTVNGAVTGTAGPCGHGQAAWFRGDKGTPAFLQIPAHPDWSIVQGSIDLWVRPAANPTGAVQGLVSRDAEGVRSGGHFTLSLLPDFTLALRIQDEVADVAVSLCSSERLVVGRWTHVAVNFGPPEAEIFIDGRRAQPRGGMGAFESCGLNGSRGLAGNNNPWVIGADLVDAIEGTGRPVSNPFSNGALDHVRISDRRQDFAALVGSCLP